MRRFKAILYLLRPQQWLKNLLLYFPPFLGGTLLHPGMWHKGLLPFAVFSLASSAGYVLNDLIDRDADRNHPRKSARPLASGQLSIVAGASLVLILAVVALVVAFQISATLLVIIVGYLIISASYSFCLKNLPVVDLFCISSGFLFRLQAGGISFGVQISEWLFLSVLLLSLFLSAGKRLAEKQLLVDGASAHRKVLVHYPDGFLDGVLFMTGSAVLVTYTMYTLSHHAMLYTVPLCCFGLLRYILRVKTGQGGDPTESLLHDPWLFAVGAAWTGMVGWGAYVG